MYRGVFGIGFFKVLGGFCLGLCRVYLMVVFSLDRRKIFA